MADTAALMDAIVDLLPDEARLARIPTDEDAGPDPTPGVTVSTRTVLARTAGAGRRSRWRR